MSDSKNLLLWIELFLKLAWILKEFVLCRNVTTGRGQNAFIKPVSPEVTQGKAAYPDDHILSPADKKVKKKKKSKLWNFWWWWRECELKASTFSVQFTLLLFLSKIPDWWETHLLKCSPESYTYICWQVVATDIYTVRLVRLFFAPSESGIKIIFADKFMPFPGPWYLSPSHCYPAMILQRVYWSKEMSHIQRKSSVTAVWQLQARESISKNILW